MSMRSDSDVRDFIESAIYNDIDHVRAWEIASDLSKKYDFLSVKHLMLGWAQLPKDELSMEISQKELNVLYEKLRSRAKKLQESIAPLHVMLKVHNSRRLLTDLDDLIDVETPKRKGFRSMNECMFLGSVALEYDRIYPPEKFKKNDLLVQAALDIENSFNFRKKHSRIFYENTGSFDALNKYLQRGRKLFMVATRATQSS